MDDLPELPFEKVLSYMDLGDLIRSRAVSRRWYHKINSLRVSSLFYSDRPIGFIYEKGRLASGSFAHHSLSSSKFRSFVNTSRQPILFNIKRLRLCGLQITKKNIPKFAQALESFNQLEELCLFRFPGPYSDLMNPTFNQSQLFVKPEKLNLTLPMLHSIRLEEVEVIGKLTLKTPKLQKINIQDCQSLKLYIVHGGSIEMLVIDDLKQIAMKKLKNLKYLYSYDSMSLSGLKQLREYHLKDSDEVTKLFEQKQRCGRLDLKIFYCGCLLKCPEEWETLPRYPIICYTEFFDYLAENISKLADEVPFCRDLSYRNIERIAPDLAICLLKKFTDLRKIEVRKVPEVLSFLEFLKEFSGIVDLSFSNDLSQDLFDRLPEYCAVQKLGIYCALSDFRFLFRLKHLLTLSIYRETPIDAESIRRVLNELPFLSDFSFSYRDYFDFGVGIEISHPETSNHNQKRFQVRVCRKDNVVLFDIDTVIQLIIDETSSRRAWEFEARARSVNLSKKSNC